MDELFLEKAVTILGEDGVLTEKDGIEAYEGDEFAGEGFKAVPAAVLRPGTSDQVSRILALCGEYGIPVTPRGAGTGLSAGCVSSPGGVVLSLERMTAVIERDAANRSLTLEAGVTLERLYHEVEGMGLFFPPHPGDEGAFIGGAVATNAGGSRAVKYGTIRKFVLGVQAVLADGRIVELGGKIMKSSTGYDLLDLVIGSEGTLAVITRVTLALLPKPGSIKTLVAPFPRLDDAIEAVPAILSRGIIPFAVEFVEHSVIRCSERLLDKRWPAREGIASLMVILDGPDEDAVLSLAETIGEVLLEAGAADVLIADRAETQADILELRSMIYEALRPATVEVFDVCVPRSQIAAHVEFVHSLEERFGVSLPTYGHAADGNVHTHSLKAVIEDGEIGAETEGWRDKHEAVRAALYRDAIARGGVISGEHGIGMVKRDFLQENIGADAVSLMRGVKGVFDPKGILNPGKVI